MSGVGRRGGINPMLAGVIAGAVMLFVVLVMAKINIDFAAPWASTHTLTVETVDADGISVSSDVRINGRLVGQVTGVRSQGPMSAITIHVDDSEWPLPSTTSASIRLATLLGQKYVELETVRPVQVRPDERTTTLPNATQTCSAVSGGHLADGATLCDAKPVVDFDQILNQFDKPTVTNIKGIIGTLSTGLTNQEGVIQQLLPDLRDLSQHSTAPLGELANRDASLNTILVNLGTVADQLNQSRDDLAGVIDQSNTLNATLATHQDALRGFIRSSDQLAQATNTVLGNGYAPKLATDLVKVNTLVHDLDNTFTKIAPQTQSFVRFAQAASHDLIYEIGDATSQSDRDGHWLREYLEGIDLSGLLAGQSSTGASSGPGNPSGSITPTLPGLPGLPSIHLAPVPVLPLPVPTLPGSPVLTPTPTPTSSGSSSSTSTCLIPGVIC